MINNTQIPSVILLFLKKVFTYESGALIFIAAPAGTAVSELLKVLMHNVNQRDLILPLLIGGATFCVYSLIFTGDFITGLRASLHEAKLNPETNTANFVKSSKLWRSFWKFFGVVCILFILTIFCLLFAMIDSWLYNIFLYAIPSIMLMVILFEFHSIGENLKRRYGKKPSYYTFFDKLTKVIEEGLITKLKNVLNK